MAITYEHIEQDEGGCTSLIVECSEKDVTIEDSAGRRCVLEYPQLEIINEAVKKYQAMRDIANA